MTACWGSSSSMHLTQEVYLSLCTEHVDKCNLCGSGPSAWATIALYDRFRYPTRSNSCMRCGMTCISPRMPQAAYNEFYASGEYRRLVNSLTGNATPLQDTQTRYANYLVDFMRPTLSAGYAGSTMLDLGGSTGILAAAFRDAFGLIPTVLDPAEGEVEQARGRGIEAIVGDAETFQPGDRRWGIVGIFQSIDHFLNPMAVLATAREVMEPGGLLIVDIAELRMLLAKRKSIEDICKLDHPHAFTEYTLRAMLEQAGFVVLMTGYSEPVGKMLCVCRRDLPRPGTRPDPSSVVEWFALLHNLRMRREYDYHNQGEVA